MSTKSFWKSLLPTIGQDRIIDDISRMRNEVVDSLLPTLYAGGRDFHSHPFKSSVSQTYERVLRQKTKLHGGLFDMLSTVFKDVPTVLDQVEQLVESHFGKDITKEALTYRGVSVLRFLEVVNFAIQYTTRVALRVVIAEAMVAAGKGDVGDASISERESAYLDGKYADWQNAIELLAQSPAAILAKLEATPDVVIDEHTEGAVTATLGSNGLDPLKLNFITPTSNPIYFVRSLFAEWDVESVKRAKEESTMVQLRLRELHLARAGQTDPRLEQAIEVSEDRLKKLDFKIAKLSGHLD